MLTPTENMALTTPMAMGMRRLGKLSLIMPKARGNMPMPIPCTARKAMSMTMEVEKAQPIRPMVYPTMESIITFFFP